MTEPDKRRTVRSYVLRGGRMTTGQERAYAENWERWGLEHEAGVFDAAAVFGNSAPLTLEIGFGMGQSLVEMARAEPGRNFVGIEVHKPGVGRLLHSMAEEEIENIRVYRHDAVEVLRDCIPDQSVDTLQIFFPDPWHKKKHHKRRLIQADFVEKLAACLKPAGVIHLATDWENYAEQMMEVLSASDSFANTCGVGDYAPRPDSRPLTKFEKRGERLGHGVWDLIFEKIR
jgi:tRNA (guanine-N7-)-methyltransferase